MKYYYDIFISYSTKNIEFAERLANDLKEQGFIVFLDKWEIQLGQNVHLAIENALQKSLKIIYIISPHSIEGKWTPLETNYFFDEIHLKNEIKLIPLILKQCNIPQNIKKLRMLDLTHLDDHNIDNPDFEKIYDLRFIELINDLKNIKTITFGEYEFHEFNEELENLIRLIEDRLLFYFNFDKNHIITYNKACYELVANAFEHSKADDKRVNLEIKANLSSIEVIVTDRGQGFDLERKLEKLEEELKKDPSKERGRGLLFLINGCSLENTTIEKKHKIKAIIGIKESLHIL